MNQSIQAKRKDLLRAVRLVAEVVPTRSTLPASSCVLIGTDMGMIHLRTSDIISHAEASCEATCDAGHLFGVNAKLLLSFLANSTGDEVSIIIGDRVQFQCGTSKAILSRMDGAEFPAVPTVEGVAIDMNPTELASKLSKVLPSASDEEHRMALCGVLFEFSKEGLTLVACDGKQMATETIVCKGEGSFIVPTRLAQLIVTFLREDENDARITFSERAVRVESGSLSIQGNLIESIYPNWKTVIPTTKPKLVAAKREDLVSAIQSTLPFNDAGFTQVTMDGTKTNLLFSGGKHDTSSREIDSKSFAFESLWEGKRLLSLIEPLEKEEVTIELHEEGGGWCAVVHEDDFTSVLMSLRKG